MSLHCKKRLTIFPFPAGIIRIFPSRESLVSDIPAEDGKMANPFLQCNQTLPGQESLVSDIPAGGGEENRKIANLFLQCTCFPDLVAHESRLPGLGDVDHVQHFICGVVRAKFLNTGILLTLSFLTTGVRKGVFSGGV
jgi:hypothetical protein